MRPGQGAHRRRERRGARGTGPQPVRSRGRSQGEEAYHHGKKFTATVELDWWIAVYAEPLT